MERSKLNFMKQKLIIVGGGGHARSILSIAKQNKLFSKLIGYTDLNKGNLPIKYLGSDETIIKKYKANEITLLMGIGINLKLRQKIIRKFQKYNFLKLIDKNSIISDNCNIGEGSVIFPNATIGPNVKIGRFCVIHNSVVIEHDVSVKDNSYIGPGAVVCGNVKISKNVLLGANSTMIQDTFIEQNCILGAGSVLIKSFKNKDKSLIGAPAKIKK